MQDIRYSVSYLFPLIAVTSLLAGGWTLILVPAITFVAIPVLELFFVGSEDNLSEEEAQRRTSSRFYNWLLYGFLPVQFGLILLMSYLIGTQQLIGWEVVGAIFTVGICCGAFGINVGHELGHRNNVVEQTIAKGLLLSSLYMHFFIEHNRGHHLRVATPEDPATSQFGSVVYSFWLRSVGQGYLSAWALEKRRLERKKLPVLHWRNEMIWYHLIQGGVLLSIGLLFGSLALVAFIGAASIGILLLETINYVEHYGLERSLRANGRYERVQPHHSWNSNHPIGRMLLFELTRHSDHHAYASRRYPVLRHFEASPQLPYGYPAMIVLALFPPVWFSIMNPHVERELNRLEQLAS